MSCSSSATPAESPIPGCSARDRIEILDGHLGSRTAQEIFGYDPSWA